MPPLVNTLLNNETADEVGNLEPVLGDAPDVPMCQVLRPIVEHHLSRLSLRKTLGWSGILYG